MLLINLKGICCIPDGIVYMDHCSLQASSMDGYWIKLNCFQKASDSIRTCSGHVASCIGSYCCVKKSNCCIVVVAIEL